MTPRCGEQGAPRRAHRRARGRGSPSAPCRRPRRAAASTSAGSGARSSAGSCAPQCAPLSHGPSRWMPASSPARTSGASARTDASSRSGVSVTRLATIVVVPWARWVASTVAASAGSPEVKAAPPPPCEWASTNPGTSVPVRCRSAGAGGVPPPAPVTRSPSVSHPARLDRAGREDDAVSAEQHLPSPSRVRRARASVVSACLGLRRRGVRSSSSSSRPGVRRFHLRMTNRKRK